jgi:hypothetical protein
LLTEPEPNALSEEVLSGFKNKFGKFFGTDHLLLEGWRSYAASLKVKPDDDGIKIFYFGAITMFKTQLEMFSTGDKEQVLKRMESVSPDRLWEGFRPCIASEISSERLDQHKKAFYGGGWFVNATFMAMANEVAEQYLKGIEALHDETSEFTTNIKREGERIIGSQKEYLNRDHGSKNEKLEFVLKLSEAPEFVLKLSEALAQVSNQPTSDILEIMTSTYTISRYMISLEHKLIESISCPKCYGRSLQEIRRASLNPRKDLDWPYNSPGGDEYHFRCSTCSNSFSVTFWFTK